ncbi:hypothetical protein GCM10009863_10390 [Streptomyces axinellae]|uniref:NADH:flavin oxidoreductase/NADH oxidase N-terminal domain-containing protein n=1 Tax=Streptomyces axinellae TaxID=552788 RepID=A0ABP6C4H8_9ACTN
MDGVEVHAANGYLPHQFLSPATDHRTDAYGGDPLARVRFVTEVADAVGKAIGADRVGIRVSPGINLHGALEEEPHETAGTYQALVDQLSAPGLAYLHTIGDPGEPLVKDLLDRFTGSTLVNTGWEPVTDPATATELTGPGRADVIAVGRPFIADPDLVTRWRNGRPLGNADPATIYGGDPRGYTDHPRYDQPGHAAPVS